MRARSRRGPIGRTWWSARWTAVLEAIGLGDRLYRGRSLARSGSVLTFELAEGEVVAEVRGSRHEAHQVRIAMTPIPPEDWARLFEVLSRRAIFAARLLAGEMPAPIEEAFAEAGLSLFPSSAGDLEIACDCVDPARPCSHAAAVLYILAERFDEDPFRIFHFRGCGQTQLLEGLKQQRAPVAEPAPAEPAPEAETEEAARGDDPATLERYWDLAADLSPLDPRIASPAIAEAVLRRLGPPPGAIHGSPAEEALRNAYRIASAWALKLALSDEGTEET